MTNFMNHTDMLLWSMRLADICRYSFVRIVFLNKMACYDFFGQLKPVSSKWILREITREITIHTQTGRYTLYVRRGKVYEIDSMITK